MRADSRAILTNSPPSGAFRGFGVPQAAVAHESLVDELAIALGIDPLEFRRRNALRAGDRTATGQVLEASVGLVACLDALRPRWTALRAKADAFNASAAARRRGRVHVVRLRQHLDVEPLLDACHPVPGGTGPVPQRGAGHLRLSYLRLWQALEDAKRHLDQPGLLNERQVIAGNRAPSELKDHRNDIAHWHTGRIDRSYLSDLQYTAMELLRRKYGGNAEPA